MDASALTPGYICMLLRTARLTSLSQQQRSQNQPTHILRGRRRRSGGDGGKRRRQYHPLSLLRGWGRDLMGVNNTCT